MRLYTREGEEEEFCICFAIVWLTFGAKGGGEGRGRV